MEKRYGPFADRLLDAYPLDGDRIGHAARGLMRDAAFGWQTWSWAKLQAETGEAPVYFYYFDQHPPRDGESPEADHGAPHGLDVPYVFQTLDRNDAKLTEVDWELSDLIATYWTNFAKRGDPNSSSVPQWPRFTEAQEKVMVLKHPVQVGPVPDAEALEVLDDYFEWRRTEEGKAWAK